MSIGLDEILVQENPPLSLKQLSVQEGAERIPNIVFTGHVEIPILKVVWKLEQHQDWISMFAPAS